MLSGRGGRRYCGPECRPRCKIEGCEKPVHAREMCSAHSTREKVYGDPLAPLVRQRVKGQTCTVAGCDALMRKHPYCANHYAMHRDHGEIRDWQFRWGDGGYISTHTWISRQRGKAVEHLCVDCGERAAEWSYNGGDPNERRDDQGRAFVRNLDAYSPRCLSCHRKFDDNPIAVRRKP